MPPYLIFPVHARRVLGRGLRVMYILPIRYIHTLADIHRVLYHITYALGAHTIACTGCLGANTRASALGISMNYKVPLVLTITANLL